MTHRETIALSILNGMISSPPEGVDRLKIDKKLWVNIAFDWADHFIEREQKK